MPSSPDSLSLPFNGGGFVFESRFGYELAPLINMQVVRETKDNMAGFVLANGSMSSNQSGEGDIVDTALRCGAFPQSEAPPQVVSKPKNNMVALPGQLFYSPQIPVCLLCSGKNEPAGKCGAVPELEPALSA